MPQTYSDNENIYSVDMMFAYIKDYSSPIYKVNVEKYLNTLDYEGWGDPSKNIFYSPRNVIDNPKKYKHEYERIQKANLSYPIIISNKGYVIDGVHRLSKAYLNKIPIIKAYVFDAELMKKFKIAHKKPGIWDLRLCVVSQHTIRGITKRHCR